MDAALVAIATALVTAVTTAYIENNIREQEAHLHGGGWGLYTDPFDELPALHPPQTLAALRCFRLLYHINKVWVHLTAPMQSGKTGVMSALTRIVMFHNQHNIRPDRMFVFTGMSDNEWRKQTKKRFPIHIRNNIYHRSGVSKICAGLRRLRGDGHLRNVLLFIDESHIATKKDHTPRMIYQTLTELCPRELWAENNIRIVTVSATDPAKVITIKENYGPPHQVVRLETTEGYQSIESLVRDGRIRPIAGNAHTRTAIDLMRPVIEGYDRPLYHIIRAAHGKSTETQDALTAAFPHASVITYDATSRAAANVRGEAESADLADINEILRKVPEVHTFIVIKNALYAATTMEDTHIGVLYDRQTDNDSAVLQGLAGRACGYSKSADTVVFTIQNAIERYLKTWRALCLNAPGYTVALDNADGYTAPANVMNLAVDENIIRVDETELNPLVATDEVLGPQPVRNVQPRAELVHEHLVEFFPVGAGDTIASVARRVNEWKRTTDGLHPEVKKVKFDGRTVRAIDGHRDEEGRYTAALGTKVYRVRTLEQMRESRNNLSFNGRHAARLQPCYDGATLGLALRYLTGNMIPR
jgi:hypothetical protein